MTTNYNQNLSNNSNQTMLVASVSSLSCIGMVIVQHVLSRGFYKHGVSLVHIYID